MPSKSMPIRSTKSGKKNSSECLYKLCVFCFLIETIYFCVLFRWKEKYSQQKQIKSLTEKLIRKRADTITIDMTIILTMNGINQSAQIHCVCSDAKYTLNFICCYLKNQMYAYTDTSFGRKRTHRYLEEEVEEKTRNNNNCTNENVAKRARISTRLHL